MQNAADVTAASVWQAMGTNRSAAAVAKAQERPRLGRQATKMGESGTRSALGSRSAGQGLPPGEMNAL